MNTAEEARMLARGKLSFSEILQAIEVDGSRARRAGWLDRDRWIAWEPGFDFVHSSAFRSAGNRAYADQCGGNVRVLPFLTMKKPCGSIMPGWTPTQTDMTTHDWYILRDDE